MIAENEKRLDEENMIRQDYIRSWIQPDEVRLFARERNIDSLRLMSVLSRSVGNYNEIISFISMVPDSLMDKALSLLEVVADKDLRDTKNVVLSDHLFYCNMTSAQLARSDKTDNIKYVLNPRIGNEMLGPWRSYFRTALPDTLIEESREDPSFIVHFIDETIRVANDENHYKTPITPIGVHELKVSDTWSRSIYFVSICRSLGIPSRLQEGRLIPQYFRNGKWHDVYFADQNPPSPEKGFIRFRSTDTRPVPEYYTHFTLASLENGRLITLEYDYNRKVTDFKEEIALPPGKYMLVTGNRISDNKILTSLTFFDLRENDHREINVSLRKDDSEKKILGQMDIQKALSLIGENSGLTENVRKKGLVIIWIDPEKEPTRHIFNDLPLLRSELDTWGGYFIFLNGKSSVSVSFNPESLKGLPSNSLFGNDINLEFLGSSTDITALPDEKLPFVVVTDKEGNIFYKSAGYRIGIGEQILKHVQ
jgi:hypothetical protein